VKGFLKSILPNMRTIVNVVQHLRDFGRFEMNGRQREERILIAEEEILHEIENQPRTSTRRLANLSLRIQNAAQEIHQNRGILNRVRLSWTRGAEPFDCKRWQAF
jgi:hypothetical protein